ncbi:lysine--tRNA ligase [Candidatus Enterococcus murrayae]|uniref:Lysine--tRNA ligase n=1 Tax=Candidatus Enterococcus murrayae TaxID=2815321 RepID=A0ABS3HEH4_9ENTE|nr:lysine--tRNA ligase [Enterococcus sp. MJM16]MBO0451858.1 lysine--tRNA ligase [Enterococcus sp. MJM16]
MDNLSLEEVRIAKLKEIKNPYPDRYEANEKICKVASLEDGTTDVKIAGRITAVRKIGKLTFFRISDIDGEVQAAIKKDEVGEESYNHFHQIIDTGDFIGLEGAIFTTKTGEKTLRVKEYTFLGKSYLPLPEKFHGLQNSEIIYRQRYLDLIMNKEAKERFLLRTKIIQAIRRYLENEQYIEIETPVLTNKPSGALAKPFVSHHNALDIDVFLRIAPETYLKRAIVGGFTKVFEFARCFRNEGMDATHLQDFTMLEAYCAYYNYLDNMKFLQEMLVSVIKEVYGKTQISINERLIEFDGEWPIVTFRELLIKDCGIDINQFDTAKSLLKEIKRNNIELNSTDDLDSMGKGNLIDLLYKKVSRPRIIQPTFLTEHPIELSPLARANDENPQITDRFQLIINGAEIINGYSELVDPTEQERRLEQQAKLNKEGDQEAMVMDTDYLTAMRHGMPPISGWGMGIDRLIQVITGTKNLRDSVLFPIMRPDKKSE